MNLVKRFLPSAAQSYIRQVLSEGNLFSQMIAKEIGAFRGDVFTVVGNYVSDSMLMDFKVGGKLSKENSQGEYKKVGRFEGWASPVLNTDNEIKKIIEQYLSEKNNRIVLFENRLSQPGDKWLSGRKSSVLFFEDSVVHFVTSSNINNLEESLRESRSVLSSAIFFLESDGGIELSDGAHVDQAQASKLLESISSVIIVGVYDGESFLKFDFYKQ